MRVEIGHWSAQEVLANRSTWLDLDLMRALGAGLSGRVWVALEAWARWPQQTIDVSYEECAIGLGEPARQSLGVGAYQRVRDAHRALDRAGRRIIATDPAYVAASVVKRAGWCLVVRRVSGIKARAKALRRRHSLSWDRCRQASAWRAGCRACQGLRFARRWHVLSRSKGR